MNTCLRSSTTRHTYTPSRLWKKVGGMGLLLLLTACGGNTNEQQESDTWEPPVFVDTILSIDARQVSDTASVGGHLLSYSFSIAPDDSLPVVTNADGQRYYDNVATLTVRQGQSVLLKRTFLKKDFAQFVPAKAMDLCTLAGFAFDVLRAEEGDALYFIATVGDPDEAAGVNFPVELIVSPTGALRMEVGEDLETAPMHADLNEAPAI